MSDLKQARETYLTARVQDQINWYSKKSGLNKRWFYLSRVVIIVSGALIPLLVGYSEGEWTNLKYAAGVLGVVVVISEGILSLKKYRENWSIYRLTAERLIRERYLFENGVGEDYGPGNELAFKRFVAKAEQIMAAENEEWKALAETIVPPQENP